MRKLTTYIFLCLFSVSCRTDKELSVSDYKKWMGNKDNGLYKEKTVEDFSVSCMLKPLDWIALKTIESEHLDILKLDSVKNEFKGLSYFALKIVNRQVPELINYNASGQKAYEANFAYYTGGMKQDIYLVEGSDTLNCVLFHYERNYGAAPVNIFNLAFENRNNGQMQSGRQLVFNGTYTGLGILKFDFDKNDLEHIPNVKIN